MPARSPAGDALTDLVLPVFELSGEFLAAAEEMTRPAGLTPAWWQVLGAKLLEPTAAGRAAGARLAEAQHAWADAVGAAVGDDELRRVLATVRRIIDASRAYRDGGAGPGGGPASTVGDRRSRSLQCEL